MIHVIDLSLCILGLPYILVGRDPQRHTLAQTAVVKKTFVFQNT